MPRTKSYDVNLIKDAIESYFYRICFMDINKLVMTQICYYLRENGFPTINDRKLNRDTEIRIFIDNLKILHEDLDYKKIISYTPLEVDAFIMKNNTIEKLRIALQTLDNHYSNISISAIAKYEEAKNATRHSNEQIDEIHSLKNDLEHYREELHQCKRIIKDLKLENNKYRASIKETLLPEIANEILRQEHLIIDGELSITSKGYDKMVLKDDCILKDALNDIKIQERKFNNKLVSKLFKSINED